MGNSSEDIYKERFNIFLHAFQNEEPKKYRYNGKECHQPIREIPAPIMDDKECFIPVYHSSLLPNIIDNKYYISNYGRVYDAFKNEFCNPYNNGKSDYIAIRQLGDKDRTHMYTHKLVKFYFDYRPDYKEYVIRRLDQNTTNSKLDNLEWSNPSEIKLNVSSTRKGKDCNFTTCSEADVRRACQMMQDGYPNYLIRNETGLTKSVVQKIRKRETWKSISKDYNF